MEPREPGRATAWLLPDLALALALFTLFYALAFYRAPEQLFRDSDTGWHIQTGERVLREWAVPRVDTYSFSRPGGEWFAWEWAADAAMGAAHRSGGLAGVVLLYLAGIGLCSWLWVRLHCRASAPTEDDLAREVHRYAIPRLPQHEPAPPSEAAYAMATAGSPSGLIEID